MASQTKNAYRIAKDFLAQRSKHLRCYVRHGTHDLSSPDTPHHGIENEHSLVRGYIIGDQGIHTLVGLVPDLGGWWEWTTRPPGHVLFDSESNWSHGWLAVDPRELIHEVQEYLDTNWDGDLTFGGSFDLALDVLRCVACHPDVREDGVYRSPIKFLHDTPDGQPLSTNADLKFVRLLSESISWVRGNISPTGVLIEQTVPSNAGEIVVRGTLADEKATLTITGSPATVPQTGSVDVTMLVTAEDTSVTKTYTVRLTRAS